MVRRPALRRRPACRQPSAAVLVGLLLPGSAWAHGSGRGLGAFWNGMVHAWTEPSQCLALLALGLWLAVGPSSRRAAGRAALAAAVAYTAAALAAQVSGHGLAWADGGLPDRWLQLVGLALALAVVVGRPPGRPWLAAVACALVLPATALGSPPGSLRGIDAFGWLVGVALGNGLTVAYTAIAAAAGRQRLRVGAIACRVLASWLAACLVLVTVLPLVAGPAASVPPQT